MSSERFSSFVINVLRNSGWFPGRNVGTIILNWKQGLEESDGLDMFPEAEKALLEFGGLAINQQGPGQSCARESFVIDPTLAIYEGDRFRQYSYLLKINIYPLGEACGGHCFLAIGDDERVFLLMEKILMIGKNFDEALENLILGVMPQAVEVDLSVE